MRWRKGTALPAILVAVVAAASPAPAAAFSDSTIGGFGRVGGVTQTDVGRAQPPGAQQVSRADSEHARPLLSLGSYDFVVTAGSGILLALTGLGLSVLTRSAARPRLRSPQPRRAGPRPREPVPVRRG
jgi:hypothetical protein